MWLVPSSRLRALSISLLNSVENVKKISQLLGAPVQSKDGIDSRSRMSSVVIRFVFRHTSNAKLLEKRKVDVEEICKQLLNATELVVWI